MQFFRRRYYRNNLFKTNSSIFSDILRGWGFVDLDGNSLPSFPNFFTYPTAPPYKFYCARWKYDSELQCYLRASLNANGDHQDYIHFKYSNNILDVDPYTKNSIDSHTYNGGYSGSKAYHYLTGLNLIYRDATTTLQPLKEHITLFFIPLKNRGFFMQFGKAIKPTPPYVGVIPKDPDDNYSSTPPLRKVSDFVGDTISGGFNGRETHFFHNIQNIVCFYNNISTKFNYIHLGWESCETGQGTYLGGTNYDLGSRFEKPYIDFQDENIMDDNFSDSTGEYTDVKKNVCTLIRYPYENSFLSNLFLVSTAPEAGTNTANGLDTKFFSFNGRNFFGIYNNLVVELPAN